MDLHDPAGWGMFFTFTKERGSCGTPYRCLLPKGIEGMLVAGRCMSVTHEALASTRVTATGMACGQAAGTAAALAVATRTSPRQIDVEMLQDHLVQDKAWLPSKPIANVARKRSARAARWVRTRSSSAEPHAAL